MRLKYIETVDFRKSEQTNFEALSKDLLKSLGANDVVLFISHGGDQLVFVHGFTELTANGVMRRRILRSERYRLSGGTWNPLMLANYAEASGIKLEGLKRFEEHYKKLKEEVKA